MTTKKIINSFKITDEDKGKLLKIDDDGNLASVIIDLSTKDVISHPEGLTHNGYQGEKTYNLSDFIIGDDIDTSYIRSIFVTIHGDDISNNTTSFYHSFPFDVDELALVNKSYHRRNSDQSSWGASAAVIEIPIDSDQEYVKMNMTCSVSSRSSFYEIVAARCLI